MIFLALLAAWLVSAIIAVIVWVVALLFSIYGLVLLGIIVLAAILGVITDRERR